MAYHTTADTFFIYRIETLHSFMLDIKIDNPKFTFWNIFSVYFMNEKHVVEPEEEHKSLAIKYAE